MDNGINQRVNVLDKLIREKETLSKLTQSEGFDLFLKELENVKIVAFQDLLRAGKDDIAVKQGYAQAINFMINFLNALKHDVSIDGLLKEKNNLIETVELMKEESKEPSVSYGGGDI